MARQKIIKTGFLSFLFLFFAMPALADINTNNGYSIGFEYICSEIENIGYFDGDPDQIWQMFVSSTNQFHWSFQDTAHDYGTSQTLDFECVLGQKYKILINSAENAVFIYIDGVLINSYGGLTGLSNTVFPANPAIDDSLTGLIQNDRKLDDNEINAFFGLGVAGASEFLGNIAGTAISSGVSVADRALTNGFGIILVFSFIIAFVEIYDRYIDKL